MKLSSNVGNVERHLKNSKKKKAMFLGKRICHVLFLYLIYLLELFLIK